MISRRKALAALLQTGLLGGAASMPALVFAADFPTKPITMIVPFAPGGPTDAVARSLAEAMRKTLGQTVVIESVGGAGGTIGQARAARARNDGYTVMLSHMGFVVAPALYRKLPYDTLNDFAPIGMVVDMPMLMLARSDLPVSNFAEFMKYAKANGSKMSVGNAGVGSASHLCALLFQNTLGVEFQGIPYKGTGPATADLLGKRLDAMCVSGVIPAGTVKTLAVTSKARIPLMPDVPTMNESGLKGFEMGIWHGLWAPKGTPKPAIDKLQAALQSALLDPEFKQRMDAMGTTVLNDEATPAALDKRVKTDFAKWGDLLGKVGVVPE